MRQMTIMMTIALFASVAAAPARAQDSQGAITVFVARKVITMDPTRPTATAVAVRDGQDINVWGTVFEGKAYPARTGSFK